MGNSGGGSCRLAGQFDEGPHVVNGGIRLACAQEDLLGNTARAQPHRHHVHPGRIFLDQPARQRGDTAAAGHHLHHDVGGFDGFVALGRHAGRQQELAVDVQAFDVHGVTDEHFPGQLLGLHVGRRSQGVVFGHDQHLLVVEHGFELQPRLEQRVDFHPEVTH